MEFTLRSVALGHCPHFIAEETEGQGEPEPSRVPHAKAMFHMCGSYFRANYKAFSRN